MSVGVVPGLASLETSVLERSVLKLAFDRRRNALKLRMDGAIIELPRSRDRAIAKELFDGTSPMCINNGLFSERTEPGESPVAVACGGGTRLLSIPASAERGHLQDESEVLLGKINATRASESRPSAAGQAGPETDYQVLGMAQGWRESNF